MRRAEKDAINAVLEAEYASQDDAAEAVFDCVMGLLASRDSYGVRLDYEGNAVGAYGPFYDKRKAARAAKIHEQVVGPGMANVAPLRAPSRLSEGEYTAPNGRVCDDCNHPKFAHFSFYGDAQRPRTGCIVKGCKCKTTY